MKVIFLCGGSSNRMFPIVKDKFLLNFLGKPLLQHQVEMAINAGLNQIVFIGNHNNLGEIEQLGKSLPEISADYVIQQNSTGIAGALKSAEFFLQEPVLVVNPNDVFSSTAYKKTISESSLGPVVKSCMLGYRVKKYFPGGYLETDIMANLKHIVEKPDPGSEPSNLVNILVHLHDNPRKLLKYIDSVKSDKDDVYEHALDKMAHDGHVIKVIPYDDFWAPIKYPWHIFKVMEHFLDESQSYISPTAYISDKALIEGKAILSDNVKVMENAVIRGPVYIGPNSVIGNNALLRGYCHIGANSVVGYSTEIKHSYIGNNCWFHSNYIGDSIIEDDCSFGSGAITANLRLDESNIRINVNGSDVDTGYEKLGAIIGSGCRIGINTNLMPGVRVGSHCFIGPHVCLTRDLAENKKVLSVTPQYQVLDNDINLEQNNRQHLLNSL
jgi:UDP-N-acetylglucosamine diphosphorylase / glucose-1-phosphate thymidylyltransferase / UDP-N-acetylgalactosamine diphosphorylase / glucosamine-1-phosphate N-acetyltransferase / galactosamine-1-phosphate N-acetyltransferase